MGGLPPQLSPSHREVGNPPPADHFRFCQRYKEARNQRTAVTTNSTNNSTLQYTAHLAIHFQKPGGRNPLPLRNFQKSRRAEPPKGSHLARWTRRTRLGPAGTLLARCCTRTKKISTIHFQKGVKNKIIITKPFLKFKKN